MNFKIDRYSVRMFSSKPTTSTSTNGGAVAGIFLYSGAVRRGYVYFYPDGTPLSPPVIDEESGQIALNFNLSQLEAVLMLLREEQPVYLYEEGPSNAGLETGSEPTGEEEGLGG